MSTPGAKADLAIDDVPAGAEPGPDCIFFRVILRIIGFFLSPSKSWRDGGRSEGRGGDGSRLGLLYAGHGVGVAMGRPEKAYCDHEPTYRRPRPSPARSMASRSWQALTPEPQ